MAKRKVSNPLALAVLVLLSEKPMHPYEMSTTMRIRRKEESIKLNYGSLYSVVDSLVRHGFVVPHETVREGRRPERTIYKLTDSGHAEMVDWLSELLSNPVKEFTQFEAALSLVAALPPDDVVSLLHVRAGILQTHVEAARAMATAAEGKLPRLFWVEGEFVKELMEAELKYVTRLADEIKSGKLEGVAFWRHLHALRGEGLSDEEIDERIRRDHPEDVTWMDALNDLT